MGLSVAMTGASEKALRRAGITDYEKIYLHPGNHAGYYPGSQKMALKLLFAKSDGRVLGAQAVGYEGVDKRIDVIAMALQMRASVRDLAESELCYAPQYGSAKDPVNFAGMIAANVLDGEMPLVHWRDPETAETLFLDVRDIGERSEPLRANERHIPLPQLRQRLGELPKHADLRVYCAVGQRGYVATRILRQHGIAARNISGGKASEPKSRKALELQKTKP
jgi:rhodanese-related sulfurtransferase